MCAETSCPIRDHVSHWIMKLAPSIATMTRIPIPRWRVFGAACLAHVLHDGCSSMLYLLLPFWQTELALSLTEVGILKTVYSAAMAIGQVPASRWVSAGPKGFRWSRARFSPPLRCSPSTGLRHLSSSDYCSRSVVWARASNIHWPQHSFRRSTADQHCG